MKIEQKLEPRLLTAFAIGLIAIILLFNRKKAQEVFIGIKAAFKEIFKRKKPA